MCSLFSKDQIDYQRSLFSKGAFHISEGSQGFIFISGHCNKDHLDQIKDVWHLCTHCAYYFPTNASLLAHLSQKHVDKKTVSEEDRIKCQHCTGSYINVYELHKHCRKKHAEVVKDWLLCDECSNTFRTSFTLQKVSISQSILWQLLK